MVDSLSEEVPVIFLAEEVLGVVLAEEVLGIVLAEEVLGLVLAEEFIIVLGLDKCPMTLLATSLGERRSASVGNLSDAVLHLDSWSWRSLYFCHNAGPRLPALMKVVVCSLLEGFLA